MGTLPMPLSLGQRDTRETGIKAAPPRPLNGAYLWVPTFSKPWLQAGLVEALLEGPGQGSGDGTVTQSPQAVKILTKALSHGAMNSDWPTAKD